jgi:hypothetical protein
MARTKKYLSKSKKRSFYRPIKRIKGKQKQEEEKLEEKNEVQDTQKVKKLSKPIVKKKKLIKKPDWLETKDSAEEETQPLKKLSLNDKDIRGTKIKKISPTLSPGSTDEVLSDFEENIDFSGHDEDEKVSFLQKQVAKARSNEEKYANEIERMEEKFKQEKEEMEDKLKNLRKDLHRTDPIEHNKFFTISKELSDVVEQMDDLITDEEAFVDKVKEQTSMSLATPYEFEKAINQKVDNIITNTREVVAAEQPQIEEKKEDEDEPKKKKFPKGILIIGITTFLMLAIGGGVYFGIIKKGEKVSEELLQEYLPDDVKPEVHEGSTENQDEEASSEGETKGASTGKYEESQADIPFSDTKWKHQEIPGMGFSIDYPENSVNIIKTDNSVTFIRKNGYIFKIQIMETALDVREYWKLIQSTSLNYKVKETFFRDKDALFLELEDFSDYPGDKYLVKFNDMVYDIWYATYSNNLSDDDSRRVEIMLNSFKFIE